MNLEDLANLGEFVSGIFVLVSLIYLAIQIRQNTQSQRTENFARVLERISAMQASLSRDGDLASLHARGVADVSLLTPEERVQFTWWAFEAFGAFEFMFHEARNGGIPDEVWDRWMRTMKWWLSYPGVQAWWRAKPAPFSRSFTEYVEQCLGEDLADPESEDRWQRFVRGTPTGS
jgi:hypothetical protein